MINLPIKSPTSNKGFILDLITTAEKYKISVMKV